MDIFSPRTNPDTPWKRPGPDTNTFLLWWVNLARYRRKMAPSKSKRNGAPPGLWMDGWMDGCKRQHATEKGRERESVCVISGGGFHRLGVGIWKKRRGGLIHLDCQCRKVWEGRGDDKRNYPLEGKAFIRLWYHHFIYQVVAFPFDIMLGNRGKQARFGVNICDSSKQSRQKTPADEVVTEAY